MKKIILRTSLTLVLVTISLTNDLFAQTTCSGVTTTNLPVTQSGAIWYINQGSYSNTSYYASTTVYVKNGETVTFNTCNVYFAQGCTLVVEAGGILNINNSSTSTTCTFDACQGTNAWWNGIWVLSSSTASGTLSIDGGYITNGGPNMKFLNAVYGVRAYGSSGLTDVKPSIDIHDAWFLNCRFGIYIRNYKNFTADGQLLEVYGTRFESDNNFISGCDDASGAFADNMTNEGIYLYSVGSRDANMYGIRIGDVSERRNTFVRVGNGVYGYHSNLTVLHSRFFDIRTTVSTGSYNSDGINGCGVYAYYYNINNSTTAFQMKVIVGEANTVNGLQSDTFSNIFENIALYGVRINSIGNLWTPTPTTTSGSCIVTLNRFSNLWTGTNSYTNSYGTITYPQHASSQALQMTQCFLVTGSMTKNLIENFNDGLFMEANIRDGIYEISNNNINNRNSANTAYLFEPTSRGISLLGVSQTFEIDRIELHDNNIYGAVTGLHINNAIGSDLYGNNVIYGVTTANQNGENAYGYQIEGITHISSQYNINISDASIDCDNETTGNGTTTNERTGVRLNGVLGGWIHDIAFSDDKRCIWLSGSNTGTNITCNNFSSYASSAVYLNSPSGLVSNTPFTKMPYSDVDEPSDNQWSSGGGTRVSGSVTSGSIDWNYRSGSSFDPTTGTGSITGVTFILNSSPNETSSCPGNESGYRLAETEPAVMREVYLGIATTKLNSSWSSSNFRQTEKRNLESYYYQMMNLHSDWFNTSNVSDIEYNVAYEQVKNSNAAKVVDGEKALGRGNLDVAASFFNGISPQNLYDENYQFVGNCMVKYHLKNSSKFDKSDYDRLWQIAHTRSLEGGAAVSRARALLGIIVEEPDFREDEVGTIVENEIIRVLVAPNPAQTYTAIYFNTPLQADGIIELYDISGKKVEVESLSKGVNLFTLDLSNLVNGFYSYRIIGVGPNPTTGKLLVNR